MLRMGDLESISFGLISVLCCIETMNIPYNCMLSLIAIEVGKEAEAFPFF